MAQLSVQSIVRTGLEPTLSAAAAGGDQFLNTVGRTFLLVKDNAPGDGVVVTIDIQKTYAGQAVADPTISIGVGEERMIGPFDKAWEDDSGNVQFTYDSETNVTVGAVKI